MVIQVHVTAAIAVLVLLAVTLYVIYRYLLKPLLTQVPAVTAQADTAGQGILARLKGFKTMLVARLQVALGVVIGVITSFDQLVAPYFSDGTISWQSWISPKVALWAVPALLIGGGLIHAWLRKVTTGPVGTAQG
jgi:hypothetical protein